MPKRLKNFKKSRDRSSPDKARDLFNFLWPDRAIRETCAKRLARSIRWAHKRAGASWEVTMFDWGIRLNVGQVLVLQLDSDKALIYLRSNRGHVYAAVRVACRTINPPVARIATISQADWKDHERFITAALEAKKISPFKDSFSEGALKHVESVLRTKLPRPSYVHELVGGSSRWRSTKPVAVGSSEMELLEAPLVTEGRRFLTTHFRLERNRKIVREKKRAVLKAEGHLACEVCKFDFRAYGRLGKGFCEVHHRKQLSNARSKVDTALSDLAIVCSNCHRMIHRNGKSRTLSAVRASIRLNSERYRQDYTV